MEWEINSHTHIYAEWKWTNGAEAQTSESMIQSCTSKTNKYTNRCCFNNRSKLCVTKLNETNQLGTFPTKSKANTNYNLCIPLNTSTFTNPQNHIAHNRNNDNKMKKVHRIVTGIVSSSTSASSTIDKSHICNQQSLICPLSLLPWAPSIRSNGRPVIRAQIHNQNVPMQMETFPFCVADSTTHVAQLHTKPCKWIEWRRKWRKPYSVRTCLHAFVILHTKRNETEPRASKCVYCFTFCFLSSFSVYANLCTLRVFVVSCLLLRQRSVFF